MNIYKRSLQNTGFSLLDVLIGMGISSAAMWAWNATLMQGMLGRRVIENNLDRAATARFLMGKVDCDKSYVEGVTCATGGPKALLDGNGNTIVSDAGAGSKFGSLTLKAECLPTNDGITFKATNLSSTGTLLSIAASDFEPNPLTQKTVSWSDPKSLLLPEGIALCPNFGSQMHSSEYVLIEDWEAWGVEGGACSPVKTWKVVKLNTEVSDTDSNVIINGDSSFTLRPGTYECDLSPLLSYTGYSRSRFFKLDNPGGLDAPVGTLMYSQSMYISVASPTVPISTKFTISSSTTFNLQVWCEGTGFGDALGIGTNTMSGVAKIHETFAQVQCRKYTQ